MARPTPSRTYAPRDPAITSRMMARVRGRDSKAELMLRRILWSKGHRYRLHHRGLIGRPDIVFLGPRVAVFVDGDYWHGRDLIEAGEEHFLSTMRTARKQWWLAKLQRNIERDRQVTRDLLEHGWTVIRVWESDVLREPHQVAEHISQMLR